MLDKHSNRNKEFFSVYVKKDRLDYFVAFSNIGNNLVVPIFLAGIAVYANDALKKAEIREERLKLSISILSSDSDGSSQDKKLRQWAFNTVNEQLNLDFSNEIEEYIRENRIANFRNKIATDLNSVLESPLPSQIYEKK